MTFFPELPSVNENPERESNPIPRAIYLCLSKSAFLVSFTDLEKLWPNIKSVFKLLSFGFSVSGIYRFLTFLRMEIFF